MTIETIATGTSTVQASADGLGYFLPGRHKITPVGNGFSTAGFADITFISAGKINAEGNTAVSVDAAGASVFVEETGALRGDIGVAFAGPGAGLVQNFGKVVGAGGAALDLGAQDISVLNSGLLLSKTGGAAVMARGTSLELVNSGTISGKAGAGVLLDTGADGTFSNSGLVSGRDFGIKIASVAGAVIFNSATVTATVGKTALLGGDGAERVFNTGTIEGNVRLGLGDDLLDSAEGRVTGKIFMGGGDDILRAGNRADIVDGGAGDDRLSGGRGGDEMFGGTGNDSLSGGSGNDTLRGEGGDDTLRGGRGDDTLKGGSGEDILAGGAGRDELFGGADADIFQFAIKSGVDRIADFTDGVDRIDLSAYGVLSYAAFEKALTVAKGDATIDLGMLGGAGRVIVEGIGHHLDASDFIF